MKTRLKTKKGMATLYLVAFTTLLLGITTLSFTRVMITESEEASNADLSQSALDSALAGVEDAKIALLKYHECISQRNTAGYENMNTPGCQSLIQRMENGIANGSCDVVSQVLGRESDGEVVIQETYDNDVGNDDESFNMNQAYTCVKITEENPDYRSTLTANSRVRVVPIRSTDYARVAGIQLQWHSVGSAANQIMYSTVYGDDDVLQFKTKDYAKESAPIITMDLFQTDTNFSIYELDINNENNTGTDHALITLYPQNRRDGNSGTFISASDILAISSKSNSTALGTSNANDSLTPKPVSCGYNDGYRCRSLIEFPATYQNTSSTVSYAGSGTTRAESTFFLRFTLPYGTPETDFSVTLCTDIQNGNCTPTTFTGVQAAVDSTGRASTLYRRVISRIELIDLNYPYPEFAIQLNGDENALVDKSFWVTKDCWRSDGVGGFTVCPNNGDAK